MVAGSSIDVKENGRRCRRAGATQRGYRNSRGSWEPVATVSEPAGRRLLRHGRPRESMAVPVKAKGEKSRWCPGVFLNCPLYPEIVGQRRR